MSDRVDRIAPTAFRMPTEHAEKELKDAQGTWQGETVQVDPRDAHSLVQDAKEELSSLMSEEMEVKDIKERNVEDDEYGYADRVNEIEGVWKMLQEQLPDIDVEALRELLEDFLDHDDASEDDIRRMVGERFKEPAHAFAAMQSLEQALRLNGRTALADRMASVRERFQGENGPSIRAGLNVTNAALEISAGDRDAANELRDLYRATVFDKAGPAGLYRGIIDQFGVEGFGDRLHFLTRAAGDDLASAGPSVDPAQLQQLIGELSTLRVLDTVHERCGVMVGRLDRQNQVKLEPTAVMQALLPLTEEPVNGPSKVLAVPEKLGIPQDHLEARINLLRESREVMGMVPVAIYRDPDARGSVLRAMQEAMDISIEQEDAA
jgi:type III secretion protein W